MIHAYDAMHRQVPGSTPPPPPLSLVFHAVSRSTALGDGMLNMSTSFRIQQLQMSTTQTTVRVDGIIHLEEQEALAICFHESGDTLSRASVTLFVPRTRGETVSRFRATTRTRHHQCAPCSTSAISGESWDAGCSSRPKLRTLVAGLMHEGTLRWKTCSCYRRSGAGLARPKQPRARGGGVSPRFLPQREGRVIRTLEPHRYEIMHACTVTACLFLSVESKVLSYLVIVEGLFSSCLFAKVLPAASQAAPRRSSS